MILWLKNTFYFWTGLLELKIICHGSHLQPVWQITDGKIFWWSFKDCLAFCMIGWHSERISIVAFSFIAWKWRWIFPVSFWATIVQWVFGNSSFFSSDLAFCAGGRSTYFMIKGGFDICRKLDTLLKALICTLFHQFSTFLSFFIIERLILGMLLYIRFPKVFNHCC